MNNKTYDIIKNTALVITPILAFIASLVSIWDIPYGAQITATLTAIDTLAGAVTVIAKNIYDKNGGN